MKIREKYLILQAIMKLSIQVIEEASYVSLNLKGEIDASSSIHVQETLQDLLENGKKRIHVNCEELDYISSAGLGAFMAFAEEIQSSNGNIVFSNMKPKIYNVFQLLGLDQVMNIVEDSQQVVTFFQK